MQTEFSGKVWRFGKNIDTDLIIAARYLNTSDGNILNKFLMQDHRPGWRELVSPGDIIVADDNFGCGSSREHAPIAIKYAGIQVVIAPFFARIFYRNAFNTGLVALELKEVDRISEGDILKIDLKEGYILNETKGEKYIFNKIPDFMFELLSMGGLMPYATKQLDLKKV